MKDNLDLYSEATRNLSKEKREEFAMFFIGALSATVEQEDWVKVLELTKKYVASHE